MKRQERAALIQTVLNELFPHPPIPLQHSNIYTLLVAVLLSARTTDAQVNRVTPHLFALADSPQKMIKLSVEEVRTLIKPCGLSPQKAKNILKLSHILLEKYHGQVPRSFEDLESLPGVGHKTASVVMAQAFHEPAFPVDTHIHRCAKRWKLSQAKNVQQTEKDLKALFPRKDWIKLHLQIIYYARAYCPAKTHKIQTCPICSLLA